MSRDEAYGVCRQCGACCATFRVSFYWAEAARLGLPDALTEKISPHLLSMLGTNRPGPRCAALQGEVGERVACGIYVRRPSPCHEVQPGDEKCNQARSRHGLVPLPPGTIETIAEI